MVNVNTQQFRNKKRLNEVNENVCWGLALHEFTFDTKLIFFIVDREAEKEQSTRKIV